MLRIALVGIGDAGRHHARALATIDREGCATFSALVARDPVRGDSFRAELGLTERVKRYSSLDELLDEGACDAVILATPDGVHSSQAIACLSRGLHVLVEKPLALTTNEAEPIVAAARTSGCALVVGYHLRHHVGHELVRSRLTELLGDPRSIHVRWAWPDPAADGWRARGHEARFWSVAALGTHGIDLAMWLGAVDGDAGGSSPASGPVSAILWPPGGVDQAAEISFTTGVGVLAHVSVSVRHRAISKLVVTGTHGEIEAVGTLGARGDGAIFHRVGREVPRPLPFDVECPYVRQARAFVLAAERGFVDDAALLENVRMLDTLAPASPQEPHA